MNRRVKREIKILIFLLLFGLLLYIDSTAIKSWRYPLELSPQNKLIEKEIALRLIYFGYPAVVVIRLLIFLIKKFIRYISQ